MRAIGLYFLSLAAFVFAHVSLTWVWTLVITQ